MWFKSFMCCTILAQVIAYSTKGIESSGNKLISRNIDTFNEIPCLSFGGICIPTVECPEGQRSLGGLCPLQQRMNIECCYSRKFNVSKQRLYCKIFTVIQFDFTRLFDILARTVKSTHVMGPAVYNRLLDHVIAVPSAMFFITEEGKRAVGTPRCSTMPMDISNTRGTADALPAFRMVIRSLLEGS
ncbi:hypothetical protein RR46_02349 [Papilio xuthus]|uniref:Uncharacterized protein n=1 Tax=Papilio xuthus TaxID=66420 RepID=A0A194Q0M5_PAPXU|nr:hypothetical protein RR46_02349 [Papilio xuthus]